MLNEMLNEAEISFVGDEHVGSVVGLAPLQGVTLKSKNTITPNTLQLEIARHWESFWNLRMKSPMPRVLFRTGDIIEGRHHDSPQSWGTPFDQLECAEGMYAPLMSAFQHRFSVNGTAVHVGEEGSADEALAVRLGFDEIGGHRSVAQARVTIAGVLFDVAHEGPRAGNLPWTEGNALRGFARGIVMRDKLNGRIPPRVIVRAHGHKKCHVATSVEGIEVDAFLTPAWKARDDFGHKASNYLHLADVGGLVIRVKDGEILNFWFDCLEFSDVGETAV